MKRAMEEAEERLFWSSDEVICIAHVRNAYIRDQLEPGPDDEVCAVCGTATDEAAYLDGLLDLVVSVLRCYWGRAVDDLFYDSDSDSGYAFATVLSTDEVAAEILSGDADDELVDLVGRRLQDDQWYDPGSIWLQGRELLVFSWQQFGEWVRTSAHVPDSTPVEASDWVNEAADGVPPTQMLPRLVELIVELELVRSFAVEVPWFRARNLDRGDAASATHLGTVPADFATGSNRMSPERVAMFYGALDADTAIAELGPPALGERTVVGCWTPSRPLRLLDLTRLPALPSFFDVGRSRQRQGLQFIQEFSREVSRPLLDDADASMHYRPTQAFTGYVHDNIPDLDGLVYHSSVGPSACCVLFVENDACAETVGSNSTQGSLALILRSTT